MATSSLTPDDEARGKRAGGGVVRLPPMLLDSEKASQKILPLEFFMAWCLKLPEAPGATSPIMSSSGKSSRLAVLGDDGALAAARDSGAWSAW